MKLLLDTCSLIWWTLDQQQLHPKVLTALNGQDLYLCSISIWEIGIKIKNKKLDIGMDIQTYLNKLRELSTLNLLAVTEETWVTNLQLDWSHKDPADRTIVATAKNWDAWIVTKDQEITKFYPKIFWHEESCVNYNL